MHFKTIETSAADVAAALELIMPFGHGSRIPQQYIDDKTKEIESRNQHTADTERELTVVEAESDQLPVEPTSSVMKEISVVKETPTIDEIEDALLDDETQPTSMTPMETKQDFVDLEEILTSVASSEMPSLATEDTSSSTTPIETKQDFVDLDEILTSVASSEMPSLATEDTSSSTTPMETKQDFVDLEEILTSVASSEKPSLATEDTSSIESSAESVDIDDRQSVADGEIQPVVEEENVSIAESLDFTISVSISEDEDTGSVEESVSIEVIPKMSIAEEEESRNADDEEEEEKDMESLVVNDSMTSLDVVERTVSPTAVKPHIIDIAVEDGEEEYFQSTTSRDSFLIKLSLLGALSDVIYDDFVEQVCEYKALVMTIVKRYDVSLLREVEKPERKSLLAECKTPKQKTLKQDPKEPKGPSPEADFVPLQQRKKVLHLEPLELPDFSYVEELVRQTKSQIRESTESAKETLKQEKKNEEKIEEFSHVEELLKQPVPHIKDNAETTGQEIIQVLENEEMFEHSEPVEPEPGKGSFDMMIEDLFEDDAARDAEEIIDLVEPAMLQGSGEQLPKFRAIFEIVEDGDDEPSTSAQPSSVELQESEHVREIDDVREPAEESVPKSSAFTKPKPKFTEKSSKRSPFAPSTTMATIRAEVEEKYSKMARPTAAFDREALYSKSRSNAVSSNSLGIAVASKKKPFSLMTAYRAVSVTTDYKAPEVRVATAYAGGRAERAMPEIIDLVDVEGPMVMAE